MIHCPICCRFYRSTFFLQYCWELWRRKAENVTTPPTTSHHPACKLCRGTKEERAANQSRWQRRKWDFFPSYPTRTRVDSLSIKGPKGVFGLAFDVKLVSGLDWAGNGILEEGCREDKWRNELGRRLGLRRIVQNAFSEAKKGEKVLQWWNGAFFLSPSFSIYIEPGGCMSKLIRPRFIWDPLSNQGLHYKVISLAKLEDKPFLTPQIAKWTKVTVKEKLPPKAQLKQSTRNQQ